MINPQKFVKMPPIKRIFDVIGSIILLLLLSPFIFLIFLAFFVEQIFSPSARGLFFYCEKRISGGQEFKLCKIRVCKESVIEEVRRREGFIHTAEIEKERQNLTRAGWFIKKVYLDEWPQLFSVLKGEMSLVGPRPANLVNYQKLLEKQIYTKSVIKAGLTGHFQSCKGRSCQTDTEMDTEYIEFCQTHSAGQILWLDLKIICRTIRTVLEHKGI